MKGFDLFLTLKDDCVFSERAATEGGHRGLDYIPGGAILGAAAAQLYRTLPTVDAFLLFHSGRVRFGNGLPIAEDGERAWPVPFCWHHIKGERAEEGGRLVGERIWHLGLLDELPHGHQPQQLRRGYVTAGGELCVPTQALRLKTAIDPTTGRAREAALFGYDSLSAGQRFASRVTADADVSDGLLDKLGEVLMQEVLLGRSRSAEYGRAGVEIREIVADPGAALDLPLPLGDGAKMKETIMWLLSDLAALDDFGQPTLTPRPESLGLPRGDLLANKSFVRVRRYSPWNAHRGGPDLERQVLAQGSVLVFQLERSLNEMERARIAAGLGAHREAGLGQVSLDSPLLATEQPHFATPAKAAAEPAKPQRPVSPLVEWLEERWKSQSVRQDSATRARELAHEYRALLGSARRLKGLADRAEIGPSASQWGSALAEAKAARGDLARKLFDENNGVCKPSAPGWSDEHWDDRNHPTRSFAAWLREVLGTEPDPRFVQLLAREVMAVIKQETRR